MYANSWDEFEKAAQNLYLQNPMKVTEYITITIEINLITSISQKYMLFTGTVFFEIFT